MAHTRLVCAYPPGASNYISKATRQTLRFLGVMAPVFQALVTLAVSVLLCLLFLGKMAFAVRNHLPHMVNVILIVLVGHLFRILFQDSDDLAARLVPHRLPTAVVFGPGSSEHVWKCEDV
jgi:hypothetical protein